MEQIVWGVPIREYQINNFCGILVNWTVKSTDLKKSSRRETWVGSWLLKLNSTFHIRYRRFEPTRGEAILLFSHVYINAPRKSASVKEGGLAAYRVIMFGENISDSFSNLNPFGPPCRSHSPLQAPCSRLNPDGWWRRHAGSGVSERASFSLTTPSSFSSLVSDSTRPFGLRIFASTPLPLTTPKLKYSKFL